MIGQAPADPLREPGGALGSAKGEREKEERELHTTSDLTS